MSLTGKKEKPIIAVSLLSANWSCLGDELKFIEECDVDWIHLDIMDGNFVPNITFGPFIVKAIRENSKLFLDAHLMILNPEKYIKDFSDSGADLITLHYESTYHLHRAIYQVKDLGKKVGVAINPSTSWQSLIPVLNDIDVVTIMSVNPGFAGQSFIDSSLIKVKELSSYKNENNFSFLIQIDGGINDKNSYLAFKNGADILVSSSAFFNSKDRKLFINSLKSIC